MYKLNNKSLSWDYFQIMLKIFLSIDKFSYISQKSLAADDVVVFVLK